MAMKLLRLLSAQRSPIARQHDGLTGRILCDHDRHTGSRR